MKYMKYITKKDELKARAKAVEVQNAQRPNAFRLRVKEYHSTMISVVDKMKSRTPGKVAYMLYIKNVNLGNRKYGDWFKEVSRVFIDVECFYETEYYLISKNNKNVKYHKDNILAMVKE